jgi:hypothetical protein
MWLLGHAVANAATDASPPAGAGTAVSQTATPPGSDTSSTGSTTVGTGTNNNSTDATTGDTTGGSGGGNGASGNTGQTSDQPAAGAGAQQNTQTPTDQTATGPATTPVQNFGGDPSKPVTTVTIVTGDVTANQQANGGDVADSGNVAADSATKQSATSENTGSQATNGTGDDKSGSQGNSSTDQSSSSSNQNTGSSTDQTSSSSNQNNGHNDGKDISKSENDNSTHVSTGDISGGNGGSNSVDINTGLIGTTFNCPPQSTCVYNITTGNVTVYQEANGGNVTNSGNVSIGNREAHKKAPPATQAQAPPASPAVQTVANVTALSGAQPTSTLASTGAETSTPLTVGLLALGAGTALTLAGRRRRQVEAA